jgi:hypothetical protein
LLASLRECEVSKDVGTKIALALSKLVAGSRKVVIAALQRILWSKINRLIKRYLISDQFLLHSGPQSDVALCDRRHRIVLLDSLDRVSQEIDQFVEESARDRIET